MTGCILLLPASRYQRPVVSRMKKKQSSLTAQGIALVRAVESEKPENERVCYDPYARRFVNPFLWYTMKAFMSIGYAERRGPGVADFLVARCRYMDDYLAEQIAEGVEQVVILGAGYDSRAYRFPQLNERAIKLFEVDHPATQADKLKALNKIFGRVPEQVTYVPIDFDSESLEQRLPACGYNERLKTAFIWEGVTYYITALAVDATLAFIVQHSGPGSSVIFDYTFTSVVDGTLKRGEASSMRRYRGLTGEGMVFGIPQGSIVEFLQSRGFDRVTNATGETFKQLYFTGPNAKRAAAPVYAIATAFVAPKS